MTPFYIALALKATLWAGIVWMAALAVPVKHPRLRRALALTGLWGLWLLPCLPRSTAGLGPVSIPVPAQAASTGWVAALALIWCLGSFLLLLRLVREAASVARLTRNAEMSPQDASLQMDVRFSREIHGPCMTGWWRPCVLLPCEARRWPSSTLQAALRHEFQHARQHDGLHRVCVALLRAAFWWNPAIHALCALYETESEVCCDLAATSAGVSRRAYGEMLLAHATGMRAHGLAMPFARRAGLRGRIQRLLVAPRDSRWLLSTRWLAAMTLVAAAGVVVAAIRIAPMDLQATKSAMEQEAMVRLNADPFPASP